MIPKHVNAYGEGHFDSNDLKKEATTGDDSPDLFNLSSSSNGATRLTAEETLFGDNDKCRETQDVKNARIMQKLDDVDAGRLKEKTNTADSYDGVGST